MLTADRLFPVGTILQRPNMFSGEMRRFKVVRAGDKKLILERLNGPLGGVTEVTFNSARTNYEIVDE